MHISNKVILRWRKKNHFKTINDWQTKKKYVNEFLTVCQFIGVVLVLTIIVRFL